MHGNDDLPGVVMVLTVAVVGTDRALHAVFDLGLEEDRAAKVVDDHPDLDLPLARATFDSAPNTETKNKVFINIKTVTLVDNGFYERKH